MFVNSSYPADKMLPKGVAHAMFQKQIFDGYWLPPTFTPISSRLRRIVKHNHKKKARAYSRKQERDWS